MSYSQFQVPHFTRLNHFVRLTQGSAEGLLHIHVAAVLGTSQHHLTMLIGPSWTNGDNMWAFFVEHLSVVSIGRCSTCARHRCLQTCRVLIGNRNDFAVVKFLPDDVQTMTIVSASRAADDCDFVFGHVQLLSS